MFLTMQRHVMLGNKNESWKSLDVLDNCHETNKQRTQLTNSSFVDVILVLRILYHRSFSLHGTCLSRTSTTLSFLPLPTSVTFTMSSNPNTRVAAAAKSGAFSNSRVNYGTRKQATIGSKDSVTVSILSTVSPSAEQYKRAACFEDLISTIRTHLASFPPSDLITFLSNELPFDTTSALQSATSICNPVLQAPL